MYGSFRNDVGVETVAEIDRVDVVAVSCGAVLAMCASECRVYSPF
jgi:hypothetical protein